MAGGEGYSWFEVELETKPVRPGRPTDPEIEPLVSGGADEGFTSGGAAGPITDGERFDLTVTGTYLVSSEPVRLGFSASGSLLRQHEVQFSATSEVIRMYEFIEKGQIEPAARWNFVLADDEEILALI